MIESGGNAPEVVQAGVCIVGSGPAGMALALELERLGVSCVLLESGSRNPGGDHTRLNKTDQVGIKTDINSSNRVRGLGGTSSLWMGVCRRLDAEDFEKRPWIPDSGWPIRLPELLPFYAEAHRILELPPPDYDMKSLRARGIDEGRPFIDRDFHNFIFYRTDPPMRFGSHYGSHLEASRRIRTFVDSTVVDIETDETGTQVVALKVTTLGGRHFRVRARRFVLAAGAIQNARLLLNANTVHSHGLGNRHDMVGRNFLQHPVLYSPRLLVLNNRRQAELARRGKLNTVITTGIKPAAAQRNGLLNFHFFSRQHALVRKADRFIRMLPEGMQRFVKDTSVTGMERMGDVPDFLQAMQPVLAPQAPPAVAYALLEMRPEQAPNLDSRITLDTERDELGVRRAKMDWRLTELDRSSIKTGLKLLNHRLAWHGIGRIQSKPDQHSYPEAGETYLHGGHHHYGTTRMGDSVRRSVVDRDCRVHGLANLYIAGSSVFPTSGQVNPTLSIVALSARLAAHLAPLEKTGNGALAQGINYHDN